MLSGKYGAPAAHATSRIRSLAGGLLAFAVTALPAPALTDDRPAPLDEITVTASRLGTAVQELPASVSLVDEEALAIQFALDSDVMRALDVTVPGLTVSNGGRTACSTHIRGRQTSFQINGIPVNQDLRESNCNAMFQVSPFALERVEVVRGATAVYGSGAPGGIVNLITRRASSADLELDAVAQFNFNPDQVSDTKQYDLYAGVGQKLASWDWYGGLAYQDVGAAQSPAGTFVPREEYASWAFNGSAGLAVGAIGQLRMTGTFYREDRGREYAVDFGVVDPDGYSPVVPIEDNPFKSEGYDQLHSILVSYDLERFLGHRLNVAGYYQGQTYIQRANFFDSSFGNDFFDSDTDNERFGFRSTLARGFDIDRSVLDFQYGFDFVSNRFYRPQVDPSAGGEVIGFISPEISLGTYSAFAQGNIAFGRVRLTGGARFETYRGEVGSEDYDPLLPGAAVPGDIDDSDLTLYNVGLVFDLAPEVQIYGGFSQGAELSELGRAARGINDPGRISPEPATSDQLEIGTRGRSASLDWSAAAFYSESDRASLLQNDPSCAGEPFCPLIPLRAAQEFWGIEATADWNANERLTLGGLVTYQRGEIFDEDLGRFVEYSTDVLSPLRITGYVEYAPLPEWRNRLQATYFGEADYYTPAEEDLGFVNTDSVFLADLVSSYELGPGEITLSISNLFDKTYVNVTNQGSLFYYRAEGRDITLGYRVHR
ncbi:MAG: TonB-dependent receptor [Woeseia sp.]